MTFLVPLFVNLYPSIIIIILHDFTYRHPEPRQRPLSGTISKTLQKSDRALLTSSTVVTDDNTSDQQSMILGAPLAAGNQLHLDLQQSYITTKSQTS